MFSELSRDEFHRVTPLFEALAFNTEVPSILEGNTKGRVFVDSLDTPTVALIWDGLIGLFLAGSPDRVGFNRSLQAWIASQPMALAQAYGIDELALTFDPSAWASRLPQRLTRHKLTLESRRYHTHSGTPATQPTLGADYTVHPVTAGVLSREGLQGRDWLEGWITSYWPTTAAFLDRGIGYVVLFENSAIVSLCISVFASDSALEFGTETHSDHRGRGLSTAVAADSVNTCLSRELEPIWHCWSTNAPSIAVARKVGFQLEREYTIYKLWVPPRAE